MIKKWNMNTQLGAKMHKDSEEAKKISRLDFFLWLKLHNQLDELFLMATRSLQEKH